MKAYLLKYLDNKENVYDKDVILADCMESAIETAKYEAYKLINAHVIDIRYVSVQDGKEQYMYNLLTKKTEKWY